MGVWHVSSSLFNGYHQQIRPGCILREKIRRLCKLGPSFLNDEPYNNNFITIIQMRKLEWCQKADNQSPIIKVPLQFTFPPVEILMKQLTKLNSPHPYRIVYLGPRWDNSVLFHKKYSNGGAYEFRERKLSKNAGFLHDSMIHNQFYKNEIYYRAFEGMNPTINLQNQLIFQSRFEGGNLDCAVKISENEYDLFLRIDSNTQGHIFWFYFSVKNLKKGKKVRFNLANLTKNDTHYTKGLNPYMCSSKTKEWTQEGMSNVTFKEKKLRYDFLYEKLRIRNFYELSFQVQPDGSEQMKFAYCIPYSYSDLLRDIKEISGLAEVGSLGQTLTGVNIPMIMVGNHEQNVNKPVILITGRVHPGQSNSSIIISNFMKYICNSPQAKYLRERVLTIIVPMTNPDGVILGNSRCGASGKDLNRQFKTNSKALYPQIVLLKNLVDKISQTHDIDIYLDFHGHSRKKNMFIFGPSYNITQPQYYKCRIFPRLLSNYTSIFRYYSCSYDIPYEKRSTARAVMLNECLIPFVYTVESSLGFYHDYNLHKDMVFTRKKWEELGESVVLALKEYYEGIEQYELYIQSKKKAKKQISQEIKSINTAVSQNNAQIVISMKKSLKQPKKQLKDIKFIKLFEEIKELEEKRGKQQKKEKDSDNQSDSHDEKEELQKEKMHEFSGMVTQFVETENRIQRNQGEKVYFSAKKKEKNEKKARTKQQRRLERQQRFKDEESILKDLSQQKKVIAKRFEVRSQSKSRYRSKEQQISIKNIKKDRTEMISQQIKKYPDPYKEINLKQRQRRMILHQYLQEQVDFISVQKKNNKTNVRMFNFSKMVQNPKSLRYQDQKQYIRIKDLSHNYLDKSTDYKKGHEYYSQFSHYSQNDELNNVGKSTFINLQNMVEGGQSDSYRRFSQKDPSPLKNTDDMKHVKGRNGFPSSFYRIKYHNNQRKKLQHRKQKQLYEFQEYQKINQYNTQNNLSNYAAVAPKQLQEQQIQPEQDRNDGLFLKVKKFPVF